MKQWQCVRVTVLLGRAGSVDTLSAVFIDTVNCPFGTKLNLIEKLNIWVSFSASHFSASLNMEAELRHANFCVWYALRYSVVYLRICFC